MKQSKLIKEITEIRNTKGLNSLYAFLRRNNIAYKVEVHEFGLSTNKKTFLEKAKFVNNPLCFHYYSRSVTKKGWSYNIVRGIKVVLQ